MSRYHHLPVGVQHGASPLVQIRGPRSLLFQSLRASAPLSSFPNIVNVLLVPSKSTASFLVSVAVVVIYLCFFCCEDVSATSYYYDLAAISVVTTRFLFSKRGYYHQKDQLRQRHSSRQSHIALCWGDRSDSFNLCPHQHNHNG
jgi:hypothetical protein